MKVFLITYHCGRYRTLAFASWLGLCSLYGLFKWHAYPKEPSPLQQTWTEDYQPLHEYTTSVVIGHRRRENISWTESIPVQVTRAIYSVEDLPLNPTLPANKGREAMVYLTYIIDRYPDFPDIVFFVHAKDIAWHNNIHLDNSTLSSVLRMSGDRVRRNGYVNVRCHHYPGCPNGLQLNRPQEELDEERAKTVATRSSLRHVPDTSTSGVERYLTTSLWEELYPNEPVPARLSQACSAQFAVSRQAILRHDVADYMRWRDWLLKTELHDLIAGRIFEYMWQYIFTGESSVCPSEHECLCDGYGLCFEDGHSGLNKWTELWAAKRSVENEIYYLRYNDTKYVEMVNDTLYNERDALAAQLHLSRETAYRRGADPKIRALSLDGG